MFKRKAPGSQPASEPSLKSSEKTEPKVAAPAEKAAPAQAAGDGAPGRVQARRAGDSVAAASSRRPEFRQNVVPGGAPSNEGDDRKLVVGQGIRLSGEIKKCEKLVVEGEVEANLNDCHSLEISHNGLFKGAAVVRDAEISGRFDGQLTVNGRLLLRSTGRIEGDIRYADLEIERGGKIAGSIDMIDDEALAEEADEEIAEEAAEEAADEPEHAASGEAAPASAKAGNGGDAELDLASEGGAKPNGSDESAKDADKPSLPL